MSETPDNPPEESTGRKRAKGAKQRPPAAPAEKAATAGDSATNFIDFSSTPSGGGAKAKPKPAESAAKKDTPPDRGGAMPAGEAAAQHEDSKTSSASARAWSIPDSVQERFIQIGNKFHFPDGTEAFTHQGNRLTTRSENAIVIQSMVAIAREAGRGEITVGGTEFFRKEAWFAASLVGLVVRGYEPSEFERERLARALTARRAPPSEPSAEATVTPGAGGSPASRLPDNALIVGKLVDHGPSKYAHDPKEPMSYFVRIETERGEREIWGVDLERAFRNSLSTPGIGDEIALRAVGKAPVTVLAAKRDDQGRDIGREAIATHRNEWIVERTSFLDERRKLADIVRDTSIGPADAIKRHPELEGSYLQLQMGRALAERQYTSHEHREQFVEHLREHLARRIEFGQPLEPVHLRPVEKRPPELRSPDRDYSPTR